MNRFVLCLLPLLFVQTACGPAKPSRPAVPEESNDKPAAATRPLEKPKTPLALAEPAAPAAQIDGKDLKSMEAEALLRLANQSMAREDYSRAAAYQHWYVQKAKTGRYNLACFLARIGQVDPAFYWLQEAALEEGVDTRHAVLDEDLTSLRADPRWPKVQEFLAGCNRYFESAPLNHRARFSGASVRGSLGTAEEPRACWQRRLR
jgi:hypothetical protein